MPLVVVASARSALRPGELPGIRIGLARRVHGPDPHRQVLWNLGWPPVPPHQPGRQPDPIHPDDPDGVETRLGAHAPLQGQRECAQCRVPWPCLAWQQATLARMLPAGPPPPRKPIVGLRGERPVFSWFGPPDSFALLPCRVDWRIHAVYDPAQPDPDAVCGVQILPDVELPGPIVVCPRCLVALPDHAELYPAFDQRRLLAMPARTGPLTQCWRWWLTRCYSGSIRRAAARAVAARQRRRRRG